MEKNRTHYFDYKLFNLDAHKVFEHEHAHKVFDRMPQRDYVLGTLWFLGTLEVSY